MSMIAVSAAVGVALQLGAGLMNPVYLGLVPPRYVAMSEKAGPRHFWAVTSFPQGLRLQEFPWV
jgi:hypothetical protein